MPTSGPCCILSFSYISQKARYAQAKKSLMSVNYESATITIPSFESFVYEKNKPVSPVHTIYSILKKD